MSEKDGAAPPARGGRRPGDSGTRAAIAAAARRQFAVLGFDRTSMRQVALEAGVDPALVSHFHGSKQQLFLDVVELPFEPADVLPRVLAGPRAELGDRLARLVMAVLEDESTRQRVVGLIRAATSEASAAALIRDLLTRELMLPIARAAGDEDAEYRAGLAMSQVVGLVIARYVVAVEPLASAPASRVAADLSRALTGHLRS